MSKWKQISRPSGLSVFERKTRNCVVWVWPRNWTNRNGPATWTARCSDNPLNVDKPQRPDYMDVGFEEHVGRADKLTMAKSAAIRSAERADARRKKLKPDHADIESIARDADKQARAIVKSDPAAAKRLRAEARRIREEKFAGRRRRKVRR